MEAYRETRVDQRGLPEEPTTLLQPYDDPMSSSETNDRGLRWLAVWLVGVHLAAGLVLGGIAWLFRNESDPNLLVAVVVGFCFAQAGLIGIWTAYANRSFLARFVVTALGVGYLGMIFAVCIDAVEVSILYPPQSA